MQPIFYMNGEFVPEAQAVLPVLDRAILFSDAVYEVLCVEDGKFFDFSLHAERLRRSLQKLDVPYNFSLPHLLNICRELVQRNHMATGSIYLQVSRGVAERNFYYDKNMVPNFFMFTTCIEKSLLFAEKVLSVLVVPEGRWLRRDIKTAQLLYASLSKTQAKKKGADDVLFVEDGFITEASSANVHLIDRNNRFVTHPLNGRILPGITRHRLLEIAQQMGIEVEERPFTVQEALEAKELFISSATSFAVPISHLDGQPIGKVFDAQKSEEFFPITRQLRKMYLEKVPRE